MSAKATQLGRLHQAQLEIERAHARDMFLRKRAHRPFQPEPSGDKVWEASGRAKRFKALSDAFLTIAVEAGPEGDLELCNAALAAAQEGTG